jgi:serine/threonine protein kinase
MGIVYRALDEGLNREVALKVVAPGTLEEEAAIERFRREAKAGAAVSHPNVAVVHGTGESGGQLFLAIELLTGGSLADRLKQRGPLPWRETTEIGAAIASGLAAIHAAGIVHRDLKPANVLLDGEGRPKLTDFGLAAARVDRAGRLTKTGELLGTLEYIAPEQAESSKSADGRADLYSLGATLYALLTGRPPFDGTGVTLVKKHLLDAPVPPSKRAPSVPPELDRLVLRLLEKEPAGRGDATSVARELREIAAGKVSAPKKGGRALVVAGVAAACVLLGIAALLFGGRPRVEPDSSRSPSPSSTTGAHPTPKPTPADIPEWSVAVLATKSIVGAMSISGDGSRLLVGLGDGALELYSLERRALERRFPPSQPRESIQSVAFDPANARALSGSSDGSVVVTDLARGDLERWVVAPWEYGERQGEPATVSCALFSPDGRLGIAGDEPGRIWWWKIGSSPPERARLSPGSGGVTSLAVSPDGQLASGHWDKNRVRLATIQEDLVVDTRNYSPGRVGPEGACRVAFHEHEILCASGGVLEWLDTPALQPQHLRSVPLTAKLMTLDVRDDRALTVDAGGELVLRALPALTVLPTGKVPEEHGTPRAAALRSADSFVVATYAGHILLLEKVPDRARGGSRRGE